MSTATQGATIFYTENTGSYAGAPQHTGGTANSGTNIYTTPQDWDCDIPYFEAIAYKAGMSDSDVTEANYSFWHSGCRPTGGSPSTMSSSSTTVTVFSVWDGDWALLEEYDGSGNRVQGYVQGYHGLVKTLVDNIYYYQDELGSTSHVANASGNLIEYYRYDLYGKPQYFGPNNEQQLTSNYSVVALGNGGSRWMPEIGLYDDRNRFMSPDSGRFLQPDPIGFKGDASNLYRYVGNDWANHVDSTGLADEQGERRMNPPASSDDGDRGDLAEYAMLNVGRIDFRSLQDAMQGFTMGGSSTSQIRDIRVGQMNVTQGVPDPSTYRAGEPYQATRTANNLDGKPKQQADGNLTSTSLVSIRILDKNGRPVPEGTAVTETKVPIVDSHHLATQRERSGFTEVTNKDGYLRNPDVWNHTFTHPDGYVTRDQTLESGGNRLNWRAKQTAHGVEIATHQKGYFLHPGSPGY